MVSCNRCRQAWVRWACCKGGLPRRSRRLRRRPECVDLISALPDDLLLQILIRLRCTRAAAHTSLLSRRWRGLWTRLPELTFHNICPDPLDDALAMASTTPALSLLEIRIFNHHSLAPARISSLIQAAVRLAPAKLSVDICGDILHNGIENAVELPCFHRSTYVCLWTPNVWFTLPPAGDFPVLEDLSLYSCQIDLADLLPRCPRLRKLWISGELLSVAVHAPLLEELNVYSNGRVQRIDISAPLLKKLWLHARGGLTALSNGFSLSCSAPMVEELSWECRYMFSNVGFGQIWRLEILNLETQRIPGHNQLKNKKEISCPQQQQSPRVHVLSLYIGTRNILSNPFQSITQAISQFLVASFLILELRITRPGHVYGPMVLHVLGVSNFVRILKVELCKASKQERCCTNCPCDQPNNWKSQSISLTNLKEVEIKGFRGENHEVYFLKVILRSATMLQRMVLFFSSEVLPSRNKCKELYEAYPSVEFNIYNCAGDPV